MYHQSHLIDVSSTPVIHFFFFFSSRRRHTRFDCDWSSDVCSSDLETLLGDTAVAVNPTDKRHRAFVGKVARLPIIDLRSEEHTSELQSQSNLVCRLLLEKKKHAASITNPNRTASLDRPSAR